MILINSSPKDALKIFQPFLPIFVPVGIGCLLAVTEKEGIDAKFIDEQVEENALELITEYAKEMDKPYIFGFSVLTAAFKNSILLSRELKRLYPDSIIIFGGIHPTAMPDEVLSYPHIDFVIRGEGERPLIELYRCLKEGKDYSHIDNLSYRRDGKIIHNNRLFTMNALDNYPSFPYHLFNPKNYDLGFLISSRGCPYGCIFCSNRATTGRRYRYKSAEIVASELDLLYHKYNRRSILFLDDNFLVNKERIYTLIDEIKKRGFDKKMTFNFEARGDNVDYKLLKDLYDAGFRSIFFGLETASEEIMKTIKKGETVAECISAVKMSKEIGFHVSATFIYGLPGETHQDRMDCAMLSNELDLDMVRFNNATPYPGTELYETAKRERRLNIKGLYENFNSVSTFIENPFNKIPFSYIPEGNTENDIRMDILLSYLLFYVNFKRLKSIFTSPDKGVGWFNAGEKLLEIIKKLPALSLLFLMLCIKFGELFIYTFKKETALSLSEIINMFKNRKSQKLENTN